MDYTVHLAGDDLSAAAAAGMEAGPFCSTRSYPLPPVFVMNVRCLNAPLSDVTLFHLDHVTERLAPGVLHRGTAVSAGPEWLRDGIRSYVGHIVQAALGERTMNSIRSERWRSALTPGGALSDFTTLGDFVASRRGYAGALSYLAVEWLAERAGEPALLDYYRQLPAAADWQEAFEAAFGVPVTDFYDAFEAYRADAGPPALYPVRAWVRDRDGNPSPRTVVIASRDGLLWEDVAVTGRDGAFELDLRNGRYRLSVDLSSTGCRVPGEDDRYPGGVIVVSGAPRIFLIRLPEGSSCPPVAVP